MTLFLAVTDASELVNETYEACVDEPYPALTTDGVVPSSVVLR